jgi:hypothetical protein
VQAEPVPMRLGLRRRAAAQGDVGEGADRDADVGRHAGHVGGAHPRAGDARHDGVLQTHEEAQPEHQHGFAQSRSETQVGDAQRRQQQAFHQDGEGVDGADASSLPRAGDERRQGRAEHEGRQDGEVEEPRHEVAQCHPIRQSGDVAGHVGREHTHGVEARRIEGARHQGQGTGEPAVVDEAAVLAFADQHVTTFPVSSAGQGREGGFGVDPSSNGNPRQAASARNAR